MSTSTAYDILLTAFAAPASPRLANGAHAHVRSHKLAAPVTTLEHGKRAAVSRSNSPARDRARAHNTIQSSADSFAPVFF